MEIGSEYSLELHHLETVRDPIFEYLRDYKCVYTDSGRSALRILINHLSLSGKVLLPAYLCSSVVHCFTEEQVDFYDLDGQLNFIPEELEQKLQKDIEVVYLCHYFGILQPTAHLQWLRKKCTELKIIIIEDTTHSIFTSKKTIGDYCICSLRKWFAIPDGGVLYSNEKVEDFEWSLDEVLEQKKIYAMVLKSLTLQGKYDYNSVYRRLFAECENRFDECTAIKKMSALTRFLLNCYSVTGLIRRRKENYMYLKKQISGTALQTLNQIATCPFTYPVFINDRDYFREFLMQNKVYCAIHWPIEQRQLDGRKKIQEIAGTIISLPIDQRYGEKEMEQLSSIICGFFEKTGNKRKE